MSNSWLESLKVGDKVIVSYSFSKSIQTVRRLTIKQIILDKERFWKENGRLVGADNFNYTHLHEYNEKEVREIKRKNIISAIKGFFHKGIDIDKLTGNELLSICNILKKYKGSE